MFLVNSERRKEHYSNEFNWIQLDSIDVIYPELIYCIEYIACNLFYLIDAMYPRLIFEYIACNLFYSIGFELI